MSNSIISIVTPATNSTLTSLANAKEVMNLQTDSSQDSFLTKLITRASATISAFCGIPTFGTHTLTETFYLDLYGHQPYVYPPLILSHHPVSSITSVIQNTVTYTQNTDFILDAGMLVRTSPTGILTRWLNWTPIVVTYIAGYDLPTSVPSDLETVCLMLIQQAFTQTARDPNIVMEWVEGVGRVQYNPTGSTGMVIDSSLHGMLSPYMALHS